MFGRLVLVLCVVLGCERAATSVPAAPALAPVAADLVIRDVRVFDGERVHERTTVAVADGTVVGLGPDLVLIDAHTHVQSADQRVRLHQETHWRLMQKDSKRWLGIEPRAPATKFANIGAVPTPKLS